MASSTRSSTRMRGSLHARAEMNVIFSFMRQFMTSLYMETEGAIDDIYPSDSRCGYRVRAYIPRKSQLIKSAVWMYEETFGCFTDRELMRAYACTAPVFNRRKYG